MYITLKIFKFTYKSGRRNIYVHYILISQIFNLFIAHQCDKKGCGTVLVVDGNMKNRRSVCAAYEAGYISFAGLPGTDKTGCTNTPIQTSHFCSVHKPRVLTPEASNSNNCVIEMILERKSTRLQNFYKVC